MHIFFLVCEICLRFGKEFAPGLRLCHTMFRCLCNVYFADGWLHNPDDFYDNNNTRVMTLKVRKDVLHPLLHPKLAEFTISVTCKGCAQLTGTDPFAVNPPELLATPPQGLSLWVGFRQFPLLAIALVKGPGMVFCSLGHNLTAGACTPGCHSELQHNVNTLEKANHPV